MILLIDNYDSFTYNLAQYIGNFAEVQVLRNDDPDLYEHAEKADGLVFSPGPGWPADAGKMEEMIRDFAGKKPILGICLGHQAIMGIQHKTLPIYGLQYHPESIGTPDGLSSIQNFIEKVVK